MEKLICKICGHKALNLEPHIASKHKVLGASLGMNDEEAATAALKAYCEKFSITEDMVVGSIVHPSLLEEEEKPMVSSADHVEFCGVKIPKAKLDPKYNSMVPRLNPAYHFPAFAADVANDIIENKRIMLVGHTGCVAGDTMINLNRGGIGRAIPIKEAYKLSIGLARNGKRWDKSIITRIRSLIEAEDRIGLHYVTKFVKSGLKQTLKLTLADGSTLRATADHEIKTIKGYIPLGQLSNTDQVICDRDQRPAAKQKARYKLIMGLKYHPYADKVKGAAYGGREYNRVPEHRLAAEAALSGITLKDFVAKCRSGDTDKLTFLDPEIYAVHHKDLNHKNNDSSNLIVMSHEEHKREHGKENAHNFGIGVPTPVKVKSIKPYAMEMTYDVICEEPNRNFVANGMVIHNCGKSSLFEQMASRISQPCIRVNMNGQTTVGDFVGLYTVKGGTMEWIDGALPLAMRIGAWLIIDELGFAEPAILSVLNYVLEQGGKLTLKEKGHEIVEPHPNFRILATDNAAGCMSDFRSLYQGTNLMNEAFLDRWRMYHVDYLPADEEAKVLAASVPRMTVKIATHLVKVANMVREAFRKEEISCTFSLRRLIDWSELMIRHRDPVKAAGPSIFSKTSRQDAEVIKAIIERTMLANRD